MTESVFHNVWPIQPEDSFDDRWRFAMQLASFLASAADRERIGEVFFRIEEELRRSEWSS